MEQTTSPSQPECEMSETSLQMPASGAGEAQAANDRGEKKKPFHAREESEMRHLTEKFQKLQNTRGLEEKGEVFLCMYALLKIPRGGGQRER